MKMINESAAGEFASSQAQHKLRQIDIAKQSALQALRDCRFRDFEDAMDEAYRLGCMDDIEAWACNIVSDERGDSAAIAAADATP